MGKRKWSKEKKKLIVLEMLKSQKSVAQITKEHGVSDATAYKWRDKALKSIDNAFNSSNRGKKGNSNAEKDRLMRIIGEQACVIDTLKKFRKPFNK